MLSVENMFVFKWNSRHDLHKTLIRWNLVSNKEMKSTISEIQRHDWSVRSQTCSRGFFTFNWLFITSLFESVSHFKHMYKYVCSVKIQIRNQTLTIRSATNSRRVGLSVSTLTKKWYQNRCQEKAKKRTNVQGLQLQSTGEAADIGNVMKIRRSESQERWEDVEDLRPFYRKGGRWRRWKFYWSPFACQTWHAVLKWRNETIWKCSFSPAYGDNKSPCKVRSNMKSNLPP